ncbi:MAG TPA: metal ABC transporter substrate-binding protein [Ilumatobacteraceae bacterium]|nr:metal ABC transporter substrate-binding protein [Ilumatobacteraceae bacterium]
MQLPRMQLSRRAALVLSMGVIALVAACGDDTTSGADTDADAPAIVATTGIWADVTGNIACDGLAQLETVIPIGGDPHSFEPSLQDREVLENADLIVANGLALEESLEDTIDAAEEGGVPVFRFADHMTPIDSDDPEHANGDPHVWFDPTRVEAALPALRDALVEQAGLEAGRVDDCLGAYLSSLAATDAEVISLLDSVPVERRKLVTNHDALSYFAEHYGFDVLGAVIPAPSTLAEANPADLQALAQIIDDVDVTAIFAESQHSSTDVDALAEAVGEVEVVTLFTDSLGPPESGADTYLGLLETDARLIVEALS